MKYLLIALMLMGCGGGSEDTKEPVIKMEYKREGTQPDNLYIVTGQSNAFKCDWSYFEGITGSTVINISKSGYVIERLIEEYDSSEIVGTNPAGIILVHGESDSINKINTDFYNSKLEEYRLLISKDAQRNLPLHISSVGYYVSQPDILFDTLRNAVIEESKINPFWNIAYNDVKSFRDWGMLFDGIHFTTEGCQVMMEGVAASL